MFNLGGLIQLMDFGAKSSSGPHKFKKWWSSGNASKMPHLCMSKSEGSCGKPVHTCLSVSESEQRAWWGKIVVGWLVVDGGRYRKRNSVTKALLEDQYVGRILIKRPHKKNKMDENPAVHQVRLKFKYTIFHFWAFASVNMTVVVVVTGNDRRRWAGIRECNEPDSSFSHPYCTTLQCAVDCCLNDKVLLYIRKVVV